MSNTAIHKTQLTRGYSVAFISARDPFDHRHPYPYAHQNYHLPALVLAFWREVIVALTMLVALSLLKPALLRVKRSHLRFLVLYGLALAIFNSLWTLSVSLNGASVSTVLAYCSPAFTAMLGAWLLKERLDWSKLLAVALSLMGCVLISGALDPGRLAGQPAGDRHRHPFRPAVCRLQSFRALGLAARPEPVDHADVHVRIRGRFHAGL